MCPCRAKLPASLALLDHLLDWKTVKNILLLLLKYNKYCKNFKAMAHQRCLSRPLCSPSSLWHKSTYRSFGTPPSFWKHNQEPSGDGTITTYGVKTRNVWSRKGQSISFFNCCLKPRLSPGNVKRPRCDTGMWKQSAGWRTGVKTWASVRV